MPAPSKIPSAVAQPLRVRRGPNLVFPPPLESAGAPSHQGSGTAASYLPEGAPGARRGETATGPRAQPGRSCPLRRGTRLAPPSPLPADRCSSLMRVTAAIGGLTPSSASKHRTNRRREITRKTPARSLDRQGVEIREELRGRVGGGASGGEGSPSSYLANGSFWWSKPLQGKAIFLNACYLTSSVDRSLKLGMTLKGNAFHLHQGRFLDAMETAQPLCLSLPNKLTRGAHPVCVSLENSASSQSGMGSHLWLPLVVAAMCV